MFFAIHEFVSIENCSKLVDGLIDGYQGFEGVQLFHLLNDLTIFDCLTQNKDSIMTVEGFYARCGYVAPSNAKYLFYIDRDVNNKLVSVFNMKQQHGKTKLTASQQRQNYVPKYGYAMVQSLPETKRFPIDLGEHYPTEQNPHLIEILSSQHQIRITRTTGTVSSLHHEKWTPPPSRLSVSRNG